MALFDVPQNPLSPSDDLRGAHFCIRVPGLDDTVAWYPKTLDFRLMATTEAVGLDWVFLSPPNDDSVSIELAAGPGANDRPGGGDLEGSLKIHGWHHFCEWGEMAAGTPFPDGLICNVYEFKGDLICAVRIYVDPDFTSSDAAMLKTVRPAR